MKATAIIQARMGSTRLPGKVLLKIKDKTILEYVVSRVSLAKYVDDIIIATTVDKKDLEIVGKVCEMGIGIYCGEEEDVLDRYYQAAKLFKCEHVIRITADCPLIDPQIMDQVIERYFTSGADYCSNTIEESFPDGLDVEVFSFSSLAAAWHAAKLYSEREHVTPYIRAHPEFFHLENIKCSVNLSNRRWTLDQKEDFSLIKPIIENFYPGNPEFLMQDVIDFLKHYPELENANSGVIRNEGYAISKKNDRSIM